MQKTIGIVGATGYTGEELLKNLTNHPDVTVDFVTSEKESGNPLSDVFPHLPYYKDLTFISAKAATKKQVDLVFLCLPAGESVKLAPDFLTQNIKVIDLGADFRFNNAQDYETWYHMQHSAPVLLSKAAYGLPEWFRDQIADAKIVGNPGCYPTTVLTAVLPLLKEHILAEGPIIVDSKSGVSGAGKSPNKTTHYVQVNENFSPYKVGRVHRHVGEMEHILSRTAKHPVQVIFTPHLTPITRGMFSTIYVNTYSKRETQDILDIFEQYYTNEPFVHVLPGIPDIKMAANTNYCFLGAQSVPETHTVILYSAIDNLGKGASTQAIQNMNLMLGIPETTGLIR